MNHKKYRIVQFFDGGNIDGLDAKVRGNASKSIYSSSIAGQRCCPSIFSLSNFSMK